ncbi:MAG: hypothetical protein QW625_00335 [Candidatus Nanoarchaeia archaeon]
MVSERKKAYMRQYNAKPEIKAKKAAYMRRKRAEEKKLRILNLIRFMLNLGYENLAFAYAKEYCPEMLLAIKVKKRKRASTQKSF